MKEKLAFEDLPKQVQRRMEKRKRKKEEARLERKLRIDWSRTDDEILERYKIIYPDQNEEKLRENIKYQKLIIGATTKQSRKKQ